MEMELRILLVPLYRGDSEEVVEIERRLQYRHKEGPRGEDWWSEWKPVPEVHLHDAHK